MLLNASHEVTNCGLPDHVQTRYIRYKQGNRAIVAWMTKYGPDRFKGRKTLPIKQLVALGRYLCTQLDQVETLPPTIDYYFREVIRERSYLSHHYKLHRDQCERDELDTVNHEHFTESLRKIHKTLLSSKMSSSRNDTKCGPRRSSSSVQVPSRTSLFAHLSSDDQDSETEDEAAATLSDVETDATSQCSHSVASDFSCACSNGSDQGDFLDAEGNLAQAVEASVFLKGIDAMAADVGKTWVKSGKGQLHVSAAAAFTITIIMKIVQRVRSYDGTGVGALTLSDLKHRFCSMSCQSAQGHGHARDGPILLLESLENWQTRLRSLCRESSGNQDRKTIDQSVWAASTGTTNDDLVGLLVKSLPAILSTYKSSAITFEAVPGLEVLTRLTRSGMTEQDMLTSTLILHQLWVAHLAYSSSIGQPKSICMPRLQALQLAKEASRAVSLFVDDQTIFPCQCTNTLGYRVAQMRRDLDAFAKVNCWNALMQSPVVAGSQALEILDICSYYGMHLLHYRHYVGAIVHTYHALAELGTIGKIQIMDDMSDMFSGVLYPMSSRPSSGFVVTWLRYIGARLKFSSGRRGMNHKDTWCMSVPAHTAARSAGLNVNQRDESEVVSPKFDYGTIDYTVRLKRKGWVLAADEDAQLESRWEIGATGVSASRSNDSSSNDATRVSRGVRHARSESCTTASCGQPGPHGGPDHECCTRVEHNLGASFGTPPGTSSVATSKINLLSLFHSMTRVVSAISDTTHTVDDAENARSLTSPQVKDNGRGQMCLCFVQTILRGADRIVVVRKRSGLDAKGACWTRNEKECIECYKQHLTEELERAEEWIWKSI